MSAHAERVATEVECKIGATENVEDSTEVCRAGDIEDEIKEIDQPELIQVETVPSWRTYSVPRTREY
jgi:hypothetical protein